MRRKDRAAVVAALAVALVAVAVAWYISLSGSYREVAVVSVAYAPSAAGAPSTVTFALGAGGAPPLPGQSVSLLRFAPASPPAPSVAGFLAALTAGPLGHPLSVAGAAAGPPPVAVATSPPAGAAGAISSAFTVAGSGILRVSTATPATPS